MSDTDHLTRCFDGLSDDEPLGRRVVRVLRRLPEAVKIDLLHDPRFRITRETYEPGRGWIHWMACPDPLLGASRCVVLRERLADCAEAFAEYVIAHELAHAHLHNGGWNDISDAEEAADALAASWGFLRPSDPGFRNRPRG